ncbi:ATP-binding protein [Egbenema bharatensis]|uniref:ATP-binding protein n=1 Tax=Egbenema bharatensis TaxID=3463334 RepID=UPI003A8C6E6D
MPLPRHLLTKVSGRVPLRAVLIVPFVLQIVIAVGLTGYLSLRNGQRAVNQVADDLRREIASRIEEKLTSYLALPHQINQLNADAIEQGIVDVSDLSELDAYLAQQIRQLEQLTAIVIATNAPDYVEAITFDHQAVTINIWNPEEGGILQWTIDAQGNQSQSTATPDYDHRQRGWYRNTLIQGRPNWTEPFATITPQRLIISANQPIHDESGNAIGVTGSDLSLLEIRDFLNSLQIGKTGETFIVERDGNLIASSTNELPFQSIGVDEAERLMAVNSADPLIRATAQYLMDEFGSFDGLNTAALQFTTAEGDRQFLQIMPYADDRGIDWLVVVVIPEADFMEQIHANTRLTILLCGIALGLAILGGIITARWITKPIMQLSQAAEGMAEGDWNQKVIVQRSGELGVLAHAFNHMRDELRQSHQQLEEYSRGLEQKNEQLQTLEAELRKQLNLFLHAVSHDLRNPVIGTSIVLNSLSNQPGDELKLPRRILERMIEGNTRQLELINSLIDSHAAETWGIVIHPQPLQLHDLVEGALTDLQPILERDNATLINQIPADLPPIEGDPLQLTRVYQNLVANALKHNPPGLSLTLGAKQDEQFIHCIVADNGIGISSEQRDKLFDPYFRGSQKPKSVGLGLGLYLCRQVIEAHGGAIGVESQVGEGTTFWFTLPVVDADVMTAISSRAS